MGHGPKPVDHAAMGHRTKAMDHAAMDHGSKPMDHAAMGHRAGGGGHDHGNMVAEYRQKFWVCLVLMSRRP